MIPLSSSSSPCTLDKLSDWFPVSEKCFCFEQHGISQCCPLDFYDRWGLRTGIHIVHSLILPGLCKPFKEVGLKYLA